MVWTPPRMLKSMVLVSGAALAFHGLDATAQDAEAGAHGVLVVGHVDRHGVLAVGGVNVAQAEAVSGEGERLRAGAVAVVDGGGPGVGAGSLKEPAPA
jgi:hypothetical protein